jgi:UDP-N-acetylmuramoylalanine--D-glutamate ligase
MGRTAFVSEADLLTREQRNEFDKLGVEYEDGGHTPRCLTGCELVIPSPAVRPDHRILREAHRRGIPVRSEIEYAAEDLDAVPCVAVTGTNGKTTTVRLLGVLFSSSGTTVVAGNTGTPLISILDNARSADRVVVEISSYQLAQSERFRPTVGVLLNITPDHIDYHGSFAAYARAKERLFLWQQAGDTAVVPRALRHLPPETRGVRVEISDEHPLPDGWEEGLPPHNVSNLRAAMAAFRALDPSGDIGRLSMDAVRGALESPHRMEAVGRIGDSRVINDSKSTNAASTCVALESIAEPKVLLLGGRHKREGYGQLADAISRADVRHLVFFGEAADDLSRMLHSTPGIPPRSRCGTLEEAIEVALAALRPGDCLLFSPACSSFDQFTDFEERGAAFVNLLRSHGLH